MQALKCQRNNIENTSKTAKNVINYKFLFKNMYLQLNIINIEWKENAPLLPALFIIYRNVFRGKNMYVCIYKLNGNYSPLS